MAATVNIALIKVVLHILQSHRSELAKPPLHHSWSCRHLLLLRNLATSSMCPLELIACGFPEMENRTRVKHLMLITRIPLEIGYLKYYYFLI